MGKQEANQAGLGMISQHSSDQSQFIEAEQVPFADNGPL